MEHRDPIAVDNGLSVNKAIGFVLLAVGLFIGGWLLVNFYRILQGEDVFSALRQLMEVKELTIDGRVLALPENISNFLSLNVVFIFFFLAAMIATSLISNGVKLMQPDLTKHEKRMFEQFALLRDNIGKLNERGKNG